jgi:hypothetical protein
MSFRLLRRGDVVSQPVRLRLPNRLRFHPPGLQPPDCADGMARTRRGILLKIDDLAVAELPAGGERRLATSPAPTRS